MRIVDSLIFAYVIVGFHDCIDYIDVAGVKDAEEDLITKYMGFYD